MKQYYAPNSFLHTEGLSEYGKIGGEGSPAEQPAKEGSMKQPSYIQDARQEFKNGDGGEKVAYETRPAREVYNNHKGLGSSAPFQSAPEKGGRN